MPLKSNSSKSGGSQIFTVDSWGVQNTPNGQIIYPTHDVTTTQVPSAITTDFVVSPSPCVNPSDHKRPAAYSFTRTVVHLPRGRHKIRYDWYGKTRFAYYDWSGFDIGVPGWRANGFPGWLVDSAEPYNKALNKLYDKLRDSEASVGVTIGEGKETIEMIHAIAKAVKSPLKQLRALAHSTRDKRRRVNAINASTTVGGLYLGWSVGLAPLLSDIDNLRNHSLKDIDSSPILKASARASVTRKLSNASYNGYPFWDVDESRRCEFGVYYSIKDVGKYEQWRLGLNARPSVAWELVTLSFVVDYFYNIGNYLANLEAALGDNGLSFHSGYYTETMRRSDKYQGFLNRKVADFYGEAYQDRKVLSFSYLGSWDRVSKTRSVLSSLPLPQPPTLKIPRASGALLNIAALLSQVLNRR